MNHPLFDNRESREPAAKIIRERIERSDETLWRMEDFPDLPSAAVAQTLSRLARDKHLQRLSKGTYYRARASTFGPSRPSPNALRKLASSDGRQLFPAGTAAANLLGFTTQTPRRGEISTSAGSLPRKLMGTDIVIHTRRPQSWERLGETEAALLDFLQARRGAQASFPLKRRSNGRKSCCINNRSSNGNSTLHKANRHVFEPSWVQSAKKWVSTKAGSTSFRHSLNPLSKVRLRLVRSVAKREIMAGKGCELHETI